MKYELPATFLKLKLQLPFLNRSAKGESPFQKKAFPKVEMKSRFLRSAAPVTLLVATRPITYKARRRDDFKFKEIRAKSFRSKEKIIKLCFFYLQVARSSSLPASKRRRTPSKPCTEVKLCQWVKIQKINLGFVRRRQMTVNFRCSINECFVPSLRKSHKKQSTDWKRRKNCRVGPK